MTTRMPTADAAPPPGARVSRRAPPYRRRPRPSDAELLRLALSRASSYGSRPSTVAAEEFFSSSGAAAAAAAAASEEEEGWRTLPRRVNLLARSLREAVAAYDPDDPSNKWGGGGLFPDDPSETRRLEFTAAVFSRAPPSFLSDFRRWFEVALDYRRWKWDRDCGNLYPEEEETDYSEGPGWDEGETYSSLRTLGWLDKKLARPLGEALHGSIHAGIKSRVGGQYYETLMDIAYLWKDEVTAPWVKDLVGPDAYGRDGWEKRLDCAFSEAFCDVRIEEMFDVVADWPDSYPAVVELRDALERTSLHGRLASELRAAFGRRLIHPGAATAQIIDVYVSTINVLREIDPSDGLLDAVSGPVRACLRGRADTVRCIVTSLTDDEQAGGDLYEELRRMDARPLEQAQVDSDDEGDGPDLDWMPAPKHRGVLGKGAAISSVSGGGGDILSMLVNIYGSKELFVNEYRVMLAHKLLANLDFVTDKEVQNLELLKLRFGEMSLRSCEIMIKDVDDSKRINANIHSTVKNRGKEKGRKAGEGEDMKDVDEDEEEGTGSTVDAAIVSHIFWPALQKEPMNHHPRIKTQLDEFSLEYAKLKNPRRLVWLDQLGTVTLDLEVIEEDDEGTPQVLTREFSCSPFQATLISHFEDRDLWTASELAQKTGVAEEAVRKRMGLFVNGRVVRTVRGGGMGGGEVAYELTTLEEAAAAAEEGAEEGDGHRGDVEGAHDDDDDDGGGGVSSEAQEAEETEAYESYITGMLTNLGQLPLERIHDMLKMYVTGSEHRYDRTPRQLADLLRRMCRDGRVEVGADGMYKLVKK